MNSDKIVLVTAADQHYSKPLAAMLQSLVVHKLPYSSIHVYILEQGINQVIRQQIVTNIVNAKVKITWITIHDNRLKNMKVTGHVSLATYFKLLAPELLPDSISKFIYLDADTIINKNIEHLWKKETGTKIIAAVPEVEQIARYVSSTNGLRNYKNLGIPSKRKIFNAGVMLINTEKWKTKHITTKIFRYLLEFKDDVLLWDQDGLNAVLWNDWKELDPVWNQLSQIFDCKTWMQSPYRKDEFEIIKNKPYIIHFNTARKPWLLDAQHPYRTLFFKYLDKTYWKGWRPKSLHLETVSTYNPSYKQKNKQVIVLGMHRSGTSLVSNYLSHLGIFIGENLLPASFDAPKGFYEDIEVIKINAKILKEMNLTIFSDRNNLNELSNSLTNNNKADYQKIKKFHKVSRGLEREILSFIQKRNKKHSVWGWKDPRTVLTYKIWKQYLPEANIVILFRHPLRVADSLIRRATDPIIKNVPLSSLKSWILYNSILVDIIHNTKKEKIIVIEDKELIKQPRDFVSLLSEHCNQEISYKEITNIFDPHLMSTKINRTTKLLTLKHPFFTAKSLHLYHQLQKNSTVPIKTSSKRNFPNFLVIGTGKAGTSSIYEYLKQHPQVYMSPVKETNFFAFFDADTTTYAKEDQDWISKSITHLEEYSTQFNSIKNEKAIGEVSPIYLFHPKAAEQIKNILPKVKIIVILRNPIDRAFSGYSMHVRRGTEKRSFAKATQGNAHNASYIRGFYLEKGLYYRQLKRYYSLFPEKQIKIFLFEDLCDNPLKFMEEMYQFLEVDPMFTPNVTKWYNAAPMKTKIPSSHRKRLVEYFRTDIKQLERLTNKDLSDWLR